MTLLELLITLSLITLLSMVTVSGYQRFFQKTQDDVMSERLMRAIQLARNEAIFRGERITLCHSRDQKTCSGEWQEGYVILSKNNTLFSLRNNNMPGKLHWRAFPYYYQSIEFLPSGKPDFQNGTFWYCPEHKENPVWAMIMSQSGRARMVWPNDMGVIVDDKGKPLICQNDKAF